MSMQSFNGAGALVSKCGPSTPAEYLQLTDEGAMTWVRDPVEATSFPSMRDATRIALRLPARLRAFSIPREAH
jgi:hypothetical protein